jgi:hypothetical protein
MIVFNGDGAISIDRRSVRNEPLPNIPLLIPISDTPEFACGGGCLCCIDLRFEFWPRAAAGAYGKLVKQVVDAVT